MKGSENLLIDCSYIGELLPASSSLAIYGVRIIQGFLRYSHYHVHVLVWREKEDEMDHLVGQEFDKVVLDRDDLAINWRLLCKLSGYLPKKLKREVNRRNITTVIHPYHYDVLFFFPKNIRQFGVIHDMFIYDGKSERGKIFYFLWRKYQKILLKRYASMISISKKTREELLQREGVDSFVVYNSIPFDISIREEPVERMKEGKYILNVNRYYKYKNAETLIRALGLLKNDIPHFLYLKGDREYEEDRRHLEAVAAEVGLKDRVVFDVNYRTTGEMRFLYSHADLFVSPSLKEGFGYTPIEAVVLKTPVLVSDIEVFRDVIFGKIQTFDPNSPEDLAKKIHSMIINPPSEQERAGLSEFFLNRYSLENQIKNLTAIMDGHSEACKV
jgi:glycosyltransferase involved in cell wall biosynthesis